jgi:oligogalacturonide lyase
MRDRLLRAAVVAALLAQGLGVSPAQTAGTGAAGPQNPGVAAALPAAANEPPVEWVEPSGHRVVRLSREPGSVSLYFHQNAYTASGDKLLITTRSGLSTVDLRTRAIEPVVEGRAGMIVVGRKTRQVFYTRGDTVCATHLDTHATREIVKLPPEMHPGSGFGLTADEALLAGSYVVRDGRPAGTADEKAKAAQDPTIGRDRNLAARLAQRLPMRLFTVDVASGAVRTFLPSTDWLNHVQCSPTDPTRIMLCHEGPWHLVDRIWTIRTDGTGLKKIHTRAMDMEIAGHEFFSADGKIIWYDLQTPKSQVFWLAGHGLATGETIKYRVKREDWSVHFNVSPDGKLFAGDGGGPNSVAAPGNGQWINLFTPKDGALVAERLVDLSRHDYRFEPNVTFTPDGRWIVFRSNMHGPSHVYAVEVAKSSG